MTDLKLHQSAESGVLGWDAAIENGDLVTESGIETAILVSLFTDRRADKNDELPSDVTDLRGWWGDLSQGDKGYHIGSLLWLHGREKVTPRAIALVQERVEAALAWFIELGLAMRVDVLVEVIRNSIVMPILAISVKVFRRDGSIYARKYQYLWSD